MKFTDFWYIVALSQELQTNTVLARTILDEWLVIFRDIDGRPVALQDRCIHRNNRLSTGKNICGNLQCSYHGWRYDPKGHVVGVPAEGSSFQPSFSRRTRGYPTCEQDGYVYVRLVDEPDQAIPPFAMPHYQEPGWKTIRVINRFNNNVTNCVENFIDIPHTSFVHFGIFRTVQHQKIKMNIIRLNGSVTVSYYNETNNLGWYTKFLNSQSNNVMHYDNFHMPNITNVEYKLGENRHLNITSQSIPESDYSTLVYTDITYNYGRWNTLTQLLVWWTAQRIIRQDIKVLATQGEVIRKYGTHFTHTPADTIHRFVESIHESLHHGKDPRLLPDQSVDVIFWV